MAHTHFCSIGGVNMPKAKPTQVIVHRIELQEKEREMLEVFATTQTMKNLGYTAAAVGGVGVAYLGWKTLHDVFTGEEPSIFNFLTKEGRANYQEAIRKNPKKTFFKALFDPTGLNPFI
jgi:hypothetical protein